MDKWIITHQEPIEGIKVRLLLRYPSNILEYPTKYQNFTSKKQFGWFPHFPRPPPVDNFFTLHLSKNIIEHKRCRIRFRMGCINLYSCLISVFMNNKRAIYKFCIFWILNFFIFKISDIGLLSSKISIFIIEISLKLHLHSK